MIAEMRRHEPAARRSSPRRQLDGNLASDVMNMELLRGAWSDGRCVLQTAEESPMALARCYEYLGPDSASLRFHMRSDVRWSDGAAAHGRATSSSPTSS